MTPRGAAARSRRALGRLDRELLLAAARGRRRPVDAVMTTASGAANRSMLWLAWSAVLAATGRRDARTAATGGLLGIGIAATLVNGPLKFLWRRDRPPTTVAPLLPLPRTFSFPSGHAASAFAFAAGVAAGDRVAGGLALPAAATVAYSRVHTGVHYPSDVLVGAAVGAGSGAVAARVVERARARADERHRLDTPGRDEPLPREAVVLASPSAIDALGDARAALGRAGLPVRAVLPVADADRLRALLREDGRAPLVVAAGGDGTVGAAADAVGDRGAVLAVLPFGTSNDVARSLGVPLDPVAAAAGLARARVHDVDAARVRTGDGTERVFLHAVTTGLNVEFAKAATRRSLRDRFGGLTYPVAAAVAVRRHAPFPCTVHVGDDAPREFSAVHLSVGNAPVFGGLLGMRLPGASMTDGLLDVLVVERLSVARLSLAVADTFVGRHAPVHRVHAFRTAALRVEAAAEQGAAVDGEVAGGPPLAVTTLPGAVRVAVPCR